MGTYLTMTGPVRTPSRTLLGKVLDDAMDRRHWSQMRLAEALHCDTSHISRLRTGERRLHPANIRAWAATLEVDPYELALIVCDMDPETYRRRIADAERARLTVRISDALTEDQP